MMNFENWRSHHEQKRGPSSDQIGIDSKSNKAGPILQSHQTIKQPVARETIQQINMIARFYKNYSFFNNSFLVSNAKPTVFKPKPIAPKSPGLKAKKGELPIEMIAEQLKLKEDVLRKQLLNPVTRFVNPEQLRMLKIINGKDVVNEQQDMDGMMRKSPVVTIMGHVDHGKTTLIDYLRHSDIAQGEVGGITQKIGAFHIICHNQKITFIDTPGHEAFSNMRKRGARVTDLIVLIVSATEGVKRQTQEVIDLIIKDQIPTIVAINKIDLPHADVEGVEDSLFEAGLSIEPKGGNIPVIHISAKTGQNVDLLSGLILEETSDLKAFTSGQAEAIVLEAYQTEKGLNAMTLIVKQGILNNGSILIIGDQYFKVKNMQDDSGRNLSEAKPGDAVQVLGIPVIPAAGDFIYQVEDENKAKYIITKRRQVTSDSLHREQQKQTFKTSKIRMDYRERKKMYNSATGDAWITKFNEKEQQILQKIESLKSLDEDKPLKQELLMQAQNELINHKEYVYQFLVNIGQNKNNFNVILKFADRGIEETIHEQLVPIIQRLKQKHNLTVNILKSDVGQITNSDMEESETCNADIFTFGSEPSLEVADTLSQCSRKPKIHRLIHLFLKDFEDSAINKKKIAIKGVEKGRGVVADVFPIKAKKAGADSIFVPGVRVESGKIGKTHRLYVFRNGSPVSEGEFAKNLKVFKKEMTEVKRGDECTITVDFGPGFQFQKGDQIVAYQE